MYGELYGGNIQGGMAYPLEQDFAGFDIKDTDTFGNTVFVERAYSRRMEPDVLIENTRLPYLVKKLESIRAKPTVWVGSEDASYSPLVIFGFYKDYNITIPYPRNSMIKLTIEGLT